MSSDTLGDHERTDRTLLSARQGQALGVLIRSIHGRSHFYTRKLDSAGIDTALPIRVPDELDRLPLTTKAELVADQEASPPWGSVLSEPIDRYVRYNHTSGTTGRPLRWLDTAASWQWAVDCWKAVYEGARVGATDRVFFAFSFGPFFGFWTAYDAAVQIGAHCVPAGGMSSQQRLVLLESVRPTVVCCTPTYALRLAEVAASTGAPHRLREAGVRVVIVAGEPGGSIPATRRRIEQAWGARVIDHHGLTEVGPISFECWERPGFLHLNEAAFICEVLNPATLRPVPDGTLGELVVTNLGRTANPVIRYRTGDLVVRRSTACACGRTFAQLDGGVRARVDDMVTIRGVNVYPTAIEAVVRRFDDVVEFRATISSAGPLRALGVEIEAVGGTDGAEAVARRVADEIQESVGLAVSVTAVPEGTLPRFEMKARRFVVEP
jgi:phenylacetate-CoA ligase